MRSKKIPSLSVRRNQANGFKKSLVKRLAESAGILFSALLVFSTIVYAFTTWEPGGPPQAAPGDGNVELPSGGTSLWDTTDDTDVYRESGNVGIGTAAPAYPLSVVGTIRTQTVTGIAPYIDIYQVATKQWGIINPASTNRLSIIEDGSLGTERLTIATGGNVGIGTTVPSQKLDVAGSIRTTGTLIGSGATSTYGAITIDGSKNSWGGINFKNSGTNLGTLMVHSDYQGFYNNGDNGWDWYWLNGTLTAGSVPWARITGGPSLACTTVTQAGTGATVASCPSGYTLTGGGCWWNDPDYEYRFSMPSGNRWYCDAWTANEPVTVYAQCCKIN